MTTDLTTMARFLVLPGASELLEAFASIPPGALRTSVIDHAKVIALTYAGAPAEMQMPDPLLTAAQAVAPAPKALPKPARTPKTGEEAIVAQRLTGKHPADISRDLSTPRVKVDLVLRDARQAGVKFPSPKPNSSGKLDSRKTFPTTMDDLDARGVGVMRNAAFRRGMSLEDYIEARHKFVQLRGANMPMDEIAAQIRVAEDTLWTWLYTARRSGIDLPARLDFDDAEYEPKAPETPDATVIPIRRKPAKITSLQPGQRVFGTFEEMNGGAQHRLALAARTRGLTISAYMDLRESIVRQRMDLVPLPEIMARTGQTYNMVKDTLAIAASRGVKFPRPDLKIARQSKRASHA